MMGTREIKYTRWITLNLRTYIGSDNTDYYFSFDYICLTIFYRYFVMMSNQMPNAPKILQVMIMNKILHGPDET